MDVLSDILGSLRLTGGVIVDGQLTGDFCLSAQFTPEECAPFFPVPDRLIGYHYIRSGEAIIEVRGQAPVNLTTGDIAILPRNDPHLITRRIGLPAADASDIVWVTEEGVHKIRTGTSGPETTMWCGFLGTSESNAHPILDALPSLLTLKTRSRGSEWLDSSLRFLAEEQPSPDVVTRLAELFITQAIRDYVDQLPANADSWIQGLADPAVSKALSIIHSRYAEDLDVETLAREACVSRTVLGERFVELLGEPPMRYCASWRMRVAANMLRDRKENTANIAYSVGFNSEAAFNRAFKREYGEPPATWRRRMEAEERAQQPATSALPEQSVRYCTAHDGTRLAYSVMGDGSPLLKAANWLNHIEHDFQSPVWRHWLRELSQNRCLIRYDERACGMSDWDPPELSFDAFVDDLESVVESLHLDQFDLLGISQGAAVAIAYAVRHPEKVRRLVLCGGYAMGWAIRDDPEESARREAMITLSETGWGADNSAYRQLFTSLYIPGASPQQQQWFNEMQRVSASPENAVKLQRIFGSIDVRELLPKVTTPTIVFHARGDKAIPFSAGEYLAANIPGATFVPLESDNHIILETDDAWDDFARISREFLASNQLPLKVSPRHEPEVEQIDDIRHCIAPDGTAIAYAISGEGFPLVKAPNWITHLRHDRSNPSYRHWIAECSRGRRFLRSDMRGFGMSDLEPKEFTFDAMVEDLKATIDHAGFEKCDLLGVAHGAPIAIAYAARYPERVRKLVMVNPFAAGWRVRANPEEIAWRNSLMEMNQREWSFRRSQLGEMFLTLYFPNADQELIGWHNEHFDELGPVDRLLAMIELAADIDVREDVSRVQAPTLICHSKLDGNAPLHAGRAVADAIGDARFVELDSANHILLGNEPAWPLFVREMRAFLKRS